MPIMFMMAFESDADRIEFEAFYVQHERLLFKAARKYLEEQIDCEDAVQDACSYLIDHFETLRVLAPAQFVKYSVAVAENKAKDILKLSKRRSHEDISEYADELPSNQEEPAINLEILGALDSIPERYRQALLERYYYGLSFKEIADLRGISIGAAKKLLQRSRDALRVYLTSEWEAEV